MLIQRDHLHLWIISLDLDIELFMSISIRRPTPLSLFKISSFFLIVSPKYFHTRVFFAISGGFFFLLFRVASGFKIIHPRILLF